MLQMNLSRAENEMLHSINLVFLEAYNEIMDYVFMIIELGKYFYKCTQVVAIRKKICNIMRKWRQSRNSAIFGSLLKLYSSYFWH